MPLDVSLPEAAGALITTAATFGALGFLLRPVLRLEKRVSQISRLLSLDKPDPGSVSLVDRIKCVEAETEDTATRVAVVETRLLAQEEARVRLEGSVNKLQKSVAELVTDQGGTLQEIRDELRRLNGNDSRQRGAPIGVDSPRKD